MGNNTCCFHSFRFKAASKYTGYDLQKKFLEETLLVETLWNGHRGATLSVEMTG